MGAEINILGFVIMGILGLMLQYLDSSFILTIHIILLISEIF